jgi:exodeoxyribonuclease VII large subunit
LISATVLRNPLDPIEARADQVSRARLRGRAVIWAMLDGIRRDLAHRRAQLLALGPAATLARGYAVVQVGSQIMRSIDQAPAGADLRVRVADGAVSAVSAGPERLAAHTPISPS